MSHQQLSMIECSSCGQQLGHLYEDYYELTIKLERELKNGKIDGSYKTRHGDDLSMFLKTYYDWATDNAEKAVFQPANIIARALLRIKELDTKDLPFGMKTELDGQRDVHEVRVCCLRMFQCDPSAQSF